MQIRSANANIKKDKEKNDFSVSDIVSRMPRPRPLQHITDKEPVLEQMKIYTATFVFP